jgi:hypothetical protein
MSAWLWLLAAALAAVAAYVVGWPAWTGFAARTRRDLNAERYLAWRGRAGERRPEPSMTPGERARLVVAVVLGLAVVFCLVGFFTYA